MIYSNILNLYYSLHFLLININLCNISGTVADKSVFTICGTYYLTISIIDSSCCLTQINGKTVNYLILRVYGPNANILKSIRNKAKLKRLWTNQFEVVYRKI